MRNTIEAFINGRQVFLAAASPGEVRVDSVTLMVRKKILSRRESRTDTIQLLESNVDALADQMAELSLVLKTRQRSYCQKKGHEAGKC